MRLSDSATSTQSSAVDSPAAPPSSGLGRPRPAILRALGTADPPPAVEVNGRTYRRQAILKHDTFAATALYQHEHDRIICKFNRTRSFAGVPATWLGRALAGREQDALERLRGIKGIPEPRGPIHLAGRLQRHVTAHAYIPGQPLTGSEALEDDFFPRLERIIGQIHSRDMAHVDLSKRENLLLGENGRPHLLDFQIHFALPPHGPVRLVLRPLLALLQKADRYHLLKHQCRLRPDQLPADQRDINRHRPWWIRTWRLIATPWRQGRRRLLVLLGIRRGPGHADSEPGP